MGINQQSQPPDIGTSCKFRGLLRKWNLLCDRTLRLIGLEAELEQRVEQSHTTSSGELHRDFGGQGRETDQYNHQNKNA